jgi:CO/xanthine dehydrogenase FAD-binding subunit
MRTAVSALEVERPRSLADALERLHRSAGAERLVPLAGGTDLFVVLNAGAFAPRRFLDLQPLRELRGLRVRRDGVLEAGALATFADIGRDASVRRRWPSLAQASWVIGAAQIQNRATIAGNIANASPAGDSLPVLLAHEASVRVRSVRGERTVAMRELYRGYRQLALEPDELIVAVEVPPAPPRARTFFRKVGTRAAQSISKVVMAGVLRMGSRGAPDHVRVAWGSLAPTPVRSPAVERVLVGAKPSGDVLRSAQAALAADVSPIDDVRSERDYRMAVAASVLAQFLRAAHAGYARD